MEVSHCTVAQDGSDIHGFSTVHMAVVKSVFNIPEKAKFTELPEACKWVMDPFVPKFYFLIQNNLVEILS